MGITPRGDPGARGADGLASSPSVRAPSRHRARRSCASSARRRRRRDPSGLLTRRGGSDQRRGRTRGRRRRPRASHGPSPPQGRARCPLPSRRSRAATEPSPRSRRGAASTRIRRGPSSSDTRLRLAAVWRSSLSVAGSSSFNAAMVASSEPPRGARRARRATARSAAMSAARATATARQRPLPRRSSWRRPVSSVAGLRAPATACSRRRSG